MYDNLRAALRNGLHISCEKEIALALAPALALALAPALAPAPAPAWPWLLTTYYLYVFALYHDSLWF